MYRFAKTLTESILFSSRVTGENLFDGKVLCFCLKKVSPMNHIDRSQKLSSNFAWVVWGLAATFFFSDYLARVAPTVMHRSLQLDFGLNEAEFGILTASFYITYICMQIPVGLTVDRFSVRLILTVMSLVTALGCAIFGLADGLFVASIGRMLIGFSAAFAFISALRLATSWFPSSMLGLLAGLTQALGMLGAAAAAIVSFLSGSLGWRYTMCLIALVFVGLAVLLYQFVQDKPEALSQPKTNTHPLSIFSSLHIVLSNKQTWLNALYAGFLYAPTAVIGESYGPAYLQYGRGLSIHAAAFAIGLIFIGWGLSGPISGWLSDRMGRRKPLMILSASCGCVLSSLFIFFPSMSEKSAYLIFFLFGLTNTGVAIAYAISTEIHDRKVVGTSIAFTNMVSILVGGLLQPVVGYFLDLAVGARAYDIESFTLTDFQAGFKILPVCSFIALILAFSIKETFCKPLYFGKEKN